MLKNQPDLENGGEIGMGFEEVNEVCLRLVSLCGSCEAGKYGNT